MSKKAFIGGKQVDVIDMTPTWQAVLQISLMVLESGAATKDGRKAAIDNLKDMARVAQAYADHVKKKGKEELCFEPVKGPYTGLEIEPCVEVDDNVRRPLEEEEAAFYGVYARLTDGTAQWIADFNTQGEAEKYVKFLTSITLNLTV